MNAAPPGDVKRRSLGPDAALIAIVLAIVPFLIPASISPGLVPLARLATFLSFPVSPFLAIASFFLGARGWALAAIVVTGSVALINIGQLLG